MPENRLFLKPRDGFVIFKPTGVQLPAEGDYVNDETYWRRRLVDGDVAEATPPTDGDVVEPTPPTASTAPTASDQVEQADNTAGNRTRASKAS